MTSQLTLTITHRKASSNGWTSADIAQRVDRSPSYASSNAADAERVTNTTSWRDIDRFADARRVGIATSWRSIVYEPN
jgi:hypothetical protein